MQSPVRVLFLEDNLAFAELVQDLIATELSVGWQVVHEVRLEQACQRLREDYFDVIVSDLHVPDGHGLETIARWQAVAPQVPLVVLTGVAEPEIGTAALRQGAQDYLVKEDMTAPLLERSVRYAIERSRNQILLHQSEQRLAYLVSERTAQLEEEKQRWQALFEASRDVIVLLDRHGQIVEANQRFGQSLGYTNDEISRLPISDWIVETAPGELLRHIQTLCDERQDCQRELRFRHQEGVIYDYEVSATTFDWQGETLLLCTCRDISDRKRTAAELAISEATNRAIIAAIPDTLIRMDGHGNKTAILAGVGSNVRMLSTSISESIYTVLPHDLAEQRVHAIHEVLATGQPQKYEQVLEVAAELRHEEVRVVPLYDEEVLVILRDITDRKRAEAELAASEMTNRAILEAIPDLLIRMDRNGNQIALMSGSDSNVRMRSSSTSLNIHEILPYELAEQRVQAIGTVLDTGQPQKYEQTLEIEGELRHEEVRVVPLTEEETLVILRDISDRKQAEANLAQSEAANRAILEALPDLLMRADRDGNYECVMTDGTIAHLLPETPAVGNVYEVMPRETAQMRMDHIHRALDSGELQVYEQVFDFNGRLIDEEVRITPLNDSEVLVITRDITYRKRTEQALHQLNQDLEARVERRTTALRESESRFRSIFDQSPVGIAITDIDGYITRANPSLRHMLGYSKAEIQQQSAQELLNLQSNTRANQLFGTLLDHTLPVVSFEHQCFPKHGTPIWIKLTGAGLLDGYGRPTGFLYLIDDITREKTVEATLVEISTLQQGILDSTDYAIISSDLQGTVQTFNAGAERMLGYTADQVIGQVTSTCWHDGTEIATYAAHLSTALGYEIPPGYEALVHQARQGQITEQQWTYITREGDRVPVTLSIAPLWSQDDTRTLTGFVGIAKDITQQRQAEQVAREFQQRLESVLSSSLAVTYTCRAELPFPITFISANIETLLGYPPSEVLQSSTFFLDRIHPDERPMVGEEIVTLLRREQIAYEYRVQHRDGHYLWVRDELRMVRDERGRPREVVGYLANISDRKTAEAQVAEQQQLLQTVLDALPIPLFLKEYRGDQVSFRFINRITMEQFGLQGRDVAHIRYEEVFGEASDRFMRNDRETLALGRPTTREDQFEYQGCIVHCLLTRTPIPRPGGEQWLLAAAVDISDRKAAEEALHKTNERLALSNADLHRATRLKDEFLANMSHELRTPLNAILGLAESLEEGILGEMNSRQIRAARTIDSSGRHLLALINDILDLSKVEAGKLELQTQPTEIALLCESSMIFVHQQALKKSIRLSVEVPPRLPPIDIDEQRIRQVLINLLTNAVKFTPERGRVRLTAEVLTPADATPQLHISVIDTGIGISPENQKKLFKPFVQIDSSLNRRYEGTGLGLSLVRRLTELHGGTVGLTSTPGQGSCFTVTLPYPTWKTAQARLMGATLPSPIATPETAAANVNFEAAIAEPPTILLADDNDANTASVTAYLDKRGYRIVRAKNGREVLERVAQAPPDLIVMEMQMPEVNGLETTRRLRSNADWNHIPILALTAPTAEITESTCRAAGVNDYLPKPIRLRLLVEHIDMLLNHPHAPS